MKIENELPLGYKVIKDYPNSPFKIGDIIRFNGIITLEGVMYSTGEPQQFVRNPEKYSHIFKQINLPF